jgi:NAD(P)-dependent dehydrogenase (short-subunit alcohol dehydrogenase family)/acyl carrier protein
MDYSNLIEGEDATLRSALVTGASGLLGREISLSLASAGWRVGLVGRNPEGLDDIASAVRGAGGTAHPVVADLARTGQGKDIVLQTAAKIGPIHLIVHAASPPIQPVSMLEVPVDLEAQFAIGVNAFLEIAAAALPNMLRAQRGTFIAVLSQALLPPSPLGWQAYTIAKAGLAQAVAELNHTYAPAGIRSFSILPDMLLPSPSQSGIAPRSSQTSTVLEQSAILDAAAVAKRITAMVEDDGLLGGSAISMSAAGENVGSVALGIRSAVQAEMEPGVLDTIADTNVKIRLAEVVRRVFRIQAGAPVEQSGIGTLSGWDSLGHIKLIMEVESEFDILFDSRQSTETVTFQAIAEAVDNTLALSKAESG